MNLEMIQTVPPDLFVRSKVNCFIALRAQSLIQIQKGHVSWAVFLLRGGCSHVTQILAFNVIDKLLKLVSNEF